MTIRPIRAVEHVQIQLRDGIDHKPRQMIARQPITHIPRQQETLIPPTLNEVLSHTGIVLNVPDGSVCATPSHDSDHGAEGTGMSAFASRSIDAAAVAVATKPERLTAHPRKIEQASPGLPLPARRPGRADGEVWRWLRQLGRERESGR